MDCESGHIAHLSNLLRIVPQQDSRRLLHCHIRSAYISEVTRRCIADILAPLGDIRALTYPSSNPTSRRSLCRAFIIHSLRGAPDLNGAGVCYCSGRNEENLDAAFPIACNSTYVRPVMAVGALQANQNYILLSVLNGSPTPRGSTSARFAKVTWSLSRKNSKSTMAAWQL